MQSATSLSRRRARREEGGARRNALAFVEEVARKQIKALWCLQKRRHHCLASLGRSSPLQVPSASNEWGIKKVRFIKTHFFYGPQLSDGKEQQLLQSSSNDAVSFSDCRWQPGGHRRNSQKAVFMLCFENTETNMCLVVIKHLNIDKITTQCFGKSWAKPPLTIRQMLLSRGLAIRQPPNNAKEGYCLPSLPSFLSLSICSIVLSL